MSLTGECPSDVGLCNVGAERWADTDRTWIVAIEGSDASAVKGSEEQLGEQLPPAAPVSAVK